MTDISEIDARIQELVNLKAKLSTPAAPLKGNPDLDSARIRGNHVKTAKMLGNTVAAKHLSANGFTPAQIAKVLSKDKKTIYRYLSN